LARIIRPLATLEPVPLSIFDLGDPALVVADISGDVVLVMPCPQPSPDLGNERILRTIFVKVHVSSS